MRSDRQPAGLGGLEGLLELMGVNSGRQIDSAAWRQPDPYTPTVLQHSNERLVERWETDSLR